VGRCDDHFRLFAPTRTASWALILAILSAVSARAQSADALISSLADPDAQVRENAAAQLTRIGVSARPALVAASRSEDAAIASGASRVLLTLPWYRPEDPPEVRQLLADYGGAEEPGRIMVVSQLAELHDGTGLPALLRLVCEDPSEDVCWVIVKMFPDPRERRVGGGAPERDPRIGTLSKLIRELDPPDTRPAALVLSAHAWLSKDRNRAIGMLRRALQTETGRPTYDDGELDFAFDTLADVAAGQRRYDEAADLRRLQARRIGLTRDTYPTPIFELFVLHGKFGPLAGFDQDVRSFRRYFGYPQMMYAASRAYLRAGRDGEAMALEQAARCASLTSHSRVGSDIGVEQFLAASGWTDLARQESSAALNSDGSDGNETVVDRINARLHLGAMAAREENDSLAAEHFQAAVSLMDQVKGTLQRRGRRGQEVEFQTSDLTGQIAVHTARVAQRAGDDKAVRENVEKLLELAPTDSGLVLPAYPLLQSVGRQDDAARLFAGAYAEARLRLEQSPDDPVAMNEIAWLCARCDQKLTEALDLSTRAVAAEPDNASFLDTLAEVNFRMGRANEAVKHETRALELEPDDPFMTKQLERFRTGTK
jgi:tetratricopeptide (TPR) repeat protein